MMDYAKTASLVIKYVGGKNNIKSVTHCATRLRFQLRDKMCIRDRLSGVEPGESWPVSQHHQRRGICTGAVLLHQRRKLLPRAHSKQLGQCKVASGKWEYPAGQCGLAVRRQTGQGRISENQISQLLLLMAEETVQHHLCIYSR